MTIAERCAIVAFVLACSATIIAMSLITLWREAR